MGEIFFSPVDPEHIATAEDGISMYADNEILVVAADGVTKNQIENLAKQYDAEIVGYIEKTGDYQWKLNRGNPNVVVMDLDNNELLSEVGLNYVSSISDDTINRGSNYFNIFNVLTSGYNERMWGHETIKAPYAWSMLENLGLKEDNYIKVGLIDNAFYRHEDLGFAKIINEIQPSGKNSSHGTFVAGTFAANGDNSEGICGVYPYGNGRLYAVSYDEVINHSENGNYWSSSMHEKIEYAELIFRNVKVINQSQGFNWYQMWEQDNGELLLEYGYLENIFDEVIHDNNMRKGAIELASFFDRTLKLGYDFVIISSAGNDSDVDSENWKHYDARGSSWVNLISSSIYQDVFNRIIVVGSINKNKDISLFSNSGDRVDIYAPGEDIYSTVNTSDYMDSWKGTSMASPHVAGVAADIWTANNYLTGAQVKQIIKESVLDTSKESYPVIDAAKAVSNAIKTTGKGNTHSNYGAAMGWVFDNTDGSKEYNPKTWNGIENCAIIVYPHGESEPIEINGNKKVLLTDSNGHFELMLPEGSYDIKAIHDTYGEKMISNQQVYSNQVTYCNWIVFNEKFSGTISQIPGQDPVHTYSSNSKWAWKEYDHPNYDTSSGYDRHIIIDGDNIKMDGYLVAGYKDFLFIDDNNSTQKVFDLDFQRDQASSKDSDYNWHSMYGGGFLFNTSINEEENSISGYYILITQNGGELFKIDNMALDTFRNSPNMGNLLLTFAFDNRFDKHHIKIVVSENSVSLYDGDNLVIDSYTLNDKYGNGFGPITSHKSHDCNQRSYFTFSNITMQTM